MNKEAYRTILILLGTTFFLMCTPVVSYSYSKNPHIGSLIEKEAASQHPKNTQSIFVYGKRVRIAEYPLYVYQDGNSNRNRFFATGFMGDLNADSVDLYCKDNPYSGTSCVKITYRSMAAGDWAGMYWQYPANDWGDSPGGYDLTRAKRLTFWARGEQGEEVINVFQVGGINGKFGDTTNVSIGPITLTKQWQKYTIDLQQALFATTFSKETLQGTQELPPLSRIIGGFGWEASPDANNQNDIIFYLDEIRYECD
jgi:hypothetical protein